MLVAVRNNDYAGIRITTSKAAQRMDKPMVLKDGLIEVVGLLSVEYIPLTIVMIVHVASL